MIVSRAADGSVTIQLSRQEEDDLSFDIAMSGDTGWLHSTYLQRRFPAVADSPIYALYAALNRTYKAMAAGGGAG